MIPLKKLEKRKRFKRLLIGDVTNEPMHELTDLIKWFMVMTRQRDNKQPISSTYLVFAAHPIYKGNYKLTVEKIEYHECANGRTNKLYTYLDLSVSERALFKQVHQTIVSVLGIVIKKEPRRKLATATEIFTELNLYNTNSLASPNVYHVSGGALHIASYHLSNKVSSGVQQTSKTLIVTAKLYKELRAHVNTSGKIAETKLRSCVLKPARAQKIKSLL